MKVVCFDLDMTLMDHELGAITPSALQTIEALRAQSKIVLATGRDMNLEDNVHVLDLLKPDAVIHMSGTRVETDGVVLFEEFLNLDYIKAIVEKAYEMKWCIGRSLNRIMYTTYSHTIIERDTQYFGRCDRQFGNIEDVLHGEFSSLTVWEDTATIANMAAAFPMVSFSRFSEKFGADIVPLNITKATGMSYLLDHWGYDFKDVIAVGDSMNDYALIERSGIGIAMGNADQVLKNVADLVTDDINKDGVMKVFAKLGMV